jgi:hypothetical protein
MTPPDDDRAATPIAVGLATVLLTSVVVILRFISRGYFLRVLSLTDAAIAFSLVGAPKIEEHCIELTIDRFFRLPTPVSWLFVSRQSPDNHSDL